MSRSIFKTSRHGWPDGSEFTTEYAPTSLETLAVRQINISSDLRYVRSLEVIYNDKHHVSKRYGWIGGTITSIVLDSDEWITKVEQGPDNDAIRYLKFETNKGNIYGPYGRNEVATHVHQPLTTGFGALWFHGLSTSEYIFSLEVTFAAYSVHSGNPAHIKYERGAKSTFVRELLSPIVTLLVGTPEVSLTMHEDVLCELPFFQAALRGNFQEASSKTIKMPEDNYLIIGALIEHLKTGKYTYAHNDEQTVPNGDLEQGLFHLKVYAASMKYDCTALGVAAMGGIQFVLKNVTAVDALKIWQEGYLCGASLEQLEVGGYSRVKSRLLELYSSHPEAISAMMDESPELSKDLLKVMVTKC